MSSLPGYTLEKYVMWMHDLIVDGDGGANFSLSVAEAIGTSSRNRRELTKEEFSMVLAPYEPHRDYIEDRLEWFEEDRMSWRDYSDYAFNDVPHVVWEKADKQIKSFST